MLSKVKQILSYFDYLYLVFLPIVSIFGANQKYDDWTLPIAIIVSLILIAFWLIQGRKTEKPKNSILYLIFLFTLAIHSFIYNGEFSYILLFVSGGLVWFTIYNLRHIVTKYFFWYLIGLGITAFGIFYISMINGISVNAPNNLFLPLGRDILHNHLGDLWAIILIAIIYKASNKFELWQIPLFFLATILVAQSFSRSAVVTLIFGVLYIYQTSAKKRGEKDVFSVIFIASLALFIAISAFKTTIFSRPYILEAIGSFVKSPLGVGMGNFLSISKHSAMAHSLLLELLADLGVFSLIFIFWLIKVVSSFKKESMGTLPKVLFLAIFVNFFFDTTYSIPAMVWLWFSSLALTDFAINTD